MLRPEQLLYGQQPEPKLPDTYSIGLSLGQLGDRTALSIVRIADSLIETKRVPPGSSAEAGAMLYTDDLTYECRHLQVWQPGTPHTTIIAELKVMLGVDTLRNASASLAIDMTVAGESVAQMYRNALSVPTRFFDIVSATTGATEGHLPKREIVSLMRALLEQNRFRYATGIEHASTLMAELQHFQVKQVSPDNALLDWRNRPHDDLVIATALACWSLKKYGPYRIVIPVVVTREDIMKVLG